MGKILKPLGLFVANALFCIALLSSCNYLGCLEYTSSTPVVGIYDKGTGLSAAIDSLSVYGIGQTEGAPLLDKESSVSSFDLPLPIPSDLEQSNTVSFVLVYNQIESEYAYLTNDTITIEYSAYPYFASVDCGAMYNFVIEKLHYTKHTEYPLLDSVALLQTEIKNEGIENIQLYYNVSQE